MHLAVTRHDLPLARPLATAQGTIRVRTVWLVRLEDAGTVGWGEAAPLPGFGGETPEACAAALAACAGAWDGILPTSPCARFAVEGALLDLEARRAGLPLALHLTGDMPPVPVNALVDSPDDIRRARDAGFAVVKAKIGGDARTAHARAHALAAVGLPLRLDANGAWDAATVLAADLPPLDLLEQPLPTLAGHGALRAPGRPIGLDESIRTVADVTAAAGQADVVVLKPQFLGGWADTRAAVAEARRCGLGVVLTSALEGAIGRAAATHYASALGLTDRAHGLATGDRLAVDLATTGRLPHHGFLTLGDEPGLGLVPTGASGPAR